MWDSTASLVDASWRVLGVDLPGLGGSATVLPEPPTMAASAWAVREALEGRVVPGAPVVFAGLSMGGYVVQAAMRDYGELLDGVILLDTRSGADTPEARANRLRIADESEASGTAHAVLGMAKDTLCEASVQRRPELVEFQRSVIESQTGTGIAWSQRAMAGRPDTADTLREWGKPALVIVGQEDQITSVDVMREVAELLATDAFMVISEAGHMSPVEQPALVAAGINGFLRAKFTAR
jgi:pimeloyl-ACP methyl ester carboxylesterase